jgi:hypothetical protein
VVGGIAAVACLILVLSYPRGFIWTERAPTEHEAVLYYFAESLGEPALCRPISWDAFQRYSGAFFKGATSFYRSDCYEAVAEARGDPDVCWSVRPLFEFNPVSIGHDALSCRSNTRNARARDFLSQVLGDNPILVVDTFEQLGYNVDELYREGVIGLPIIKPDEVYRGLADNSTAMARAQALLRGPNPLSAEDAGYLADLFAITSGQAEWCERIQAGAIFRPQQVPFRDWCLLTVASNTHDSRICDRMLPAAKEEKVIGAKARGMRADMAEQLSLQARCRRQAGGGFAIYIPERPPDSQQTLRLISALGFAMPVPRDWPVREQADIYERFLLSLGPTKKDAAHQAARNELVRRLLRDDHRRRAG